MHHILIGKDFLIKLTELEYRVWRCAPNRQNQVLDYICGRTEKKCGKNWLIFILCLFSSSLLSDYCLINRFCNFFVSSKSKPNEKETILNLSTFLQLKWLFQVKAQSTDTHFVIWLIMIRKRKIFTNKSEEKLNRSFSNIFNRLNKSTNQCSIQFIHSKTDIRRYLARLWRHNRYFHQNQCGTDWNVLWLFLEKDFMANFYRITKLKIVSSTIDLCRWMKEVLHQYFIGVRVANR